MIEQPAPPGARLKALRKTLRLTQTQLGALCGISKVWVGLIERGEKIPGPQLLAWLNLAEQHPLVLEAPWSKIDQARAMQAQGYTRRTIAVRLGLSMRQVSRVWKKESKNLSHTT